MLTRTIYCTLTLLVCIFCGFLVAKPVSYLIAEPDPEISDADQKLVEATERIVIVAQGSTSNSRKSGQEIMRDAVARELKSEGITQEKETLRIIPASTPRSPSRSQSPRGRLTFSKKPTRNAARTYPKVTRSSSRNVSRSNSKPKWYEDKNKIPAVEQLVTDLPATRKSRPAATRNRERPFEGNLFSNPSSKSVVSAELASDKSKTTKALPVGFLKSQSTKQDGEQRKTESTKKAPFAALKRAVSGLNLRSEPKAPRRFVPTNPKPVSQDGSEGRQPVRPSSTGTIIQTQQSGEITRELEKLYRKDGRQMPSFRPGVGSPTLQGGGQVAGSSQNAGVQLRQAPERPQKRPLWKRIFRIGRKTEPPQNRQQPPYQQPQNQQYNPQGASQDYGNRNKPGTPNPQAPRAFPSNALNQNRIGRSNDGGSNTGSFQPFNQESRRINGDAPQFNSFSNEFDPFAIPREISPSQQAAGGTSANPKYSDPLSDEFNPFATPIPDQNEGPSLGIPPDYSKSDPTSNNFDPFADSEAPKRKQDTRTATPSTSSGERRDLKPTDNPFAEDFNPFDTSEKAGTGAPAAEDVSKGQEDPNSINFNPFGETGNEPQDDESMDIGLPDEEESPFNETTPKVPVDSTSNALEENQTSEDALSNPFPEESEADADSKNPDMNPFTGINLNDDPEDPFADTETKAPEVKLEEEPKAKVPEASDLKDSGNTEGDSGKEPRSSVDDSSVNPFNTNLEDLKKLPEPEAADKIEEKPKPTKTAVKQEDHSSKWKKIAERFGLKGFKGFCPVTLRDQRDLVDSKTEFRASFENRTYFFSSKETKEAFEKNPEHYAPVKGGIDIVLLLDDEKQSQGTLDHALWYKDRLYLFSSSESLKSFLKKPTDYLKKLEQRSLEETTKKD